MKIQFRHNQNLIPNKYWFMDVEMKQPRWLLGPLLRMNNEEITWTNLGHKTKVFEWTTLEAAVVQLFWTFVQNWHTPSRLVKEVILDNDTVSKA
jgi:hypothetical protein